MSQPKFTATKPEVRGRVKGRIIENPNASNYVVAEAAEFAGVMMGVLLGCLL